MGLREAVFLGFVLLHSGRSQTQFSSDEAFNQTSAPRATTSPQEWNQMQQGDPVAAPVSFRLRSLQLRSPAGGARKTPHTQSLQEGRALTSEQLEPRVTGRDGDTTAPHEPLSKVLVEERAPADSVSVHCGEGGVIVEVDRNFLGNGQSIHPGDLTLGGCPPAGPAGHVLQFRTELQGCDSTLKMTEEALIYAFTLKYSPTPIINTFILKTNPAEVEIQCRYQRRHHVSSGGVRPAWTQLSSSALAQQQLHFSLHLMTEDWQSPRPSSVYFLSDVMHVEASVLQGRHRPLRVYVDSCVATATPNPYAQPRYSFVSNHGCLMDAKLTGAKSYFMQRSQEDKLQFQLKAFRFYSDDRNSATTLKQRFTVNSVTFCTNRNVRGTAPPGGAKWYCKSQLHITCQLKATLVSVPIDRQHKACSYLSEAKRWVASGGDNKVCSCCETTCRGQRLRRSLATDAEPLWEGTAALGPILLQERILQAERSQLQTSDVTPAASSSSTALLGGVGAALAVVLLVFMGVVVCSGSHKPTEYSVCT